MTVSTLRSGDHPVETRHHQPLQCLSAPIDYAHHNPHTHYHVSTNEHSKQRHPKYVNYAKNKQRVDATQHYLGTDIISNVRSTDFNPPQPPIGTRRISNTVHDDGKRTPDLGGLPPAGTGRRFLRRAKRWAALQQKKQANNGNMKIGNSEHGNITDPKADSKIDTSLVDSMTGSPLIAYRMDGRPLPPPIVTLNSSNNSSMSHTAQSIMSAPLNGQRSHESHGNCACCSGGDLASMGVGLIAVKHRQHQQLAAAASFSALQNGNEGEVTPVSTAPLYSHFMSSPLTYLDAPHSANPYWNSTSLLNDHSYMNLSDSAPITIHAPPQVLPFRMQSHQHTVRGLSFEESKADGAEGLHRSDSSSGVHSGSGSSGRASQSPDASECSLNELGAELSDLSCDSACAHSDSDRCSLCVPVNTQPPPQREFIYVKRIDRDRPIALVSVMCYNVLCDKYATSTLYNYCPSWALNWEYRKNAIMKEIKQFDADILTLQEVETEQYHKLFVPELEQLGYQGVFSPKSRAKTMQEEEKKYVDGCALFWKAEKFELDREYLIEFNSLAIAKAEGSEHMLNRVMTRDNIGLCAVLKVKQPIYPNSVQHPTPQENVTGNPVVVCTAHIHWDPEFCDVKLVQAMMLMNELNKLLEEVSRSYRMDIQHIPTLLCGDFNSLPDSGVFEYLTKSCVSSDHVDLKDFRRSGQQCLRAFSHGNNPKYYTHPLKLESAYNPSLLPFTNFTYEFKGMIDYMLSSPALYRIGVLGPLDQQWLNANKILGFPHPHLPSDHIPLLAHYAIVPPAHLQQQQHHQQQQSFRHNNMNNAHNHNNLQPLMHQSAFGGGHMQNGTPGFGFGGGR